MNSVFTEHLRTTAYTTCMISQRSNDSIDFVRRKTITFGKRNVLAQSLNYQIIADSYIDPKSMHDKF